ncbi:MAG: 2-C-methyl-D-erythritol 2,4-cyclodiphosphate synthase, partial [Deltaproteobacteria bacterium]
RHFPDSDPAYKGIDSRKLLAETLAIAARRGFRVGNLDCTVIAEKPKLAPYIGTMVETIAELCGVDIRCVNVKATTTESLGFTGRGEGIAAHAVVLMLPVDVSAELDV